MRLWRSCPISLSPLWPFLFLSLEAILAFHFSSILSLRPWLFAQFRVNYHFFANRPIAYHSVALHRSPTPPSWDRLIFALTADHNCCSLSWMKTSLSLSLSLHLMGLSLSLSLSLALSLSLLSLSLLSLLSLSPGWPAGSALFELSGHNGRINGC